jgi:hypothetical protein
MREILLGVGIPHIAFMTTNRAFDDHFGCCRARSIDVSGGHTFTMRPFGGYVEFSKSVEIFAAIRGGSYFSFGLRKFALACWMPYKILPH